MDFLDPKKKRAHGIRLMIGYVLVGIAIAMATVILVYEAYGYGVNTTTGGIVQNGLVFVNSQPGPSDIYINDQFRGTTDKRFVLPSGSYSLALKKTGYRDWERKFDLDGHTIERFVYPLLIPRTVTSQAAVTYPVMPTLLTQSPDRRWLVVQTPSESAPGNFDIFDTKKPTQQKRTITIPQSLLTKAAQTGHSYEVVEWSTDNKTVLLKHVYAGGYEFIILNREEPDKALNVNKLFGVAPSEVSFFDKKADQLYLYSQSESNLRLANLRNKTISAPLLQRVLAYTSHGSNLIVYVTDEAVLAGTVQVRIWDNGVSRQLYSLPASSSYLLSLASFDGHWYYVVGSASLERVMLFKDPLEQFKAAPFKAAQPFKVLPVAQAVRATFSANARFVAAESSNQGVSIYDIENDRSSHYQVRDPLVAGLRWMDGHRFIGKTGEQLMIIDFDGTNRQLVVPTLLPNGGFFDQEYRYLFTVSVNVSGGFSLNISDLQAPDQPAAQP